MSVCEKVSIIVPVYNTAPYLNDFFNKIEEQSFQDYKLYIVYDKSDDDSLEIIKKRQANNANKYEILYSPKKDGIGAARDFALNSGRIVGDYVLFLDPDDYPDKDFLKKLVNEAEQSGADITICGFERFDDETGEVLCTEMTHNPEKLITDVPHFDLIAYMNPVVWDKLYKRTIVENLRFTNIKRTEDVFWLMRMLPRVKTIKCINESLYHYRVRGDSLLNSIKKQAYLEVLENFKTVSKEINENKSVNDEYRNVLELIAFFRCGIGITYRAAMNDMKNAKWYCSTSKQVLDEYYSGWRRNPYLKFSKCKKRGIKGLAIWGCSLLYKMNAFSIYVYLYNWFSSKFRVEVKW